MAKLSFYARGDLLVTVPGVYPQIGQALPRVGRQLASDGSLPATKEAYVTDSNSDEARRLIKLTRREGALWPADKETADACGLPFVELTFKDGVWAQKPAPSVSKRAE